MEKISYRIGDSKDLEAIANLHAQSWSDHYRASFNHTYLDGPVFEDRLSVWKERFSAPSKNQHIILAFHKDQLCGFICVYLNKDEHYGSLVDNLHVLKSYQGHGIGKTLLKKGAQYIFQHAKGSKYYLYVLKSNDQAITFYNRMHGIKDGVELFETPGGGHSKVYRFVWNQNQV